jgi:hypothetical protein
MRRIRIVFMFCVVLLVAGLMVHFSVLTADGGRPLPTPWFTADGGRPLPTPWLVADGGRPLPTPWIGIAS